MKLTQRGSKYYLVKRVPDRFKAIEPRKQVWIALRTDSLSEAKRRATDAERDLENQWVAALSGNHHKHSKFDALSALAASRGFPYVPACEVANLPLPNLLARATVSKESTTVAEAVLGSLTKPAIKLSNLIDVYMDLVSIDIKGKSRDQRRMWENTIKRSSKRFLSVVGDKNLNDLTRDDVLAYRNFWVNRIETEGVSPASANRDLTALSGICSKIYKLKGIGNPSLFRNLTFGQDRNFRAPYSIEMIKLKLIPALNKGDLNAEASDLIRVLINTGLRPSEVTGLAKNDIILDAEIPYLAIRPRPGRLLKTKTSVRDMPLVGIALDAMKRNTTGFPRYTDSPSNFSQIANKFLKTRELRPTQAHSLYSLRHGFQDRLTEVEAPDRIQADLMGHRYVRERYGKGPSLAQKAEWLSRIGFF